MRRKKIKISNIFAYIFLSIATIVSIFPFYWMIASATNSSRDVIAGRLLPGTYFLTNIQTMLDQTNFMRAFWNSTRLAVIATVLTIFVSSLAGYGFEVYKSRKKDIVFSILLISMMIPATTLIVPLFLLIVNVSDVLPNAIPFGLNTMAAVMLPGMASVFLIFFFRQSTKMFSMEILEAARIDGTSELGLFFKMFIPIMKNTYAAAGIIAFMGSWNAFMWPTIILRIGDMHTLPIVLNLSTQGYWVDFGLVMLMSFLSVIPIGIVFFVLQKHFVAGMIGTIKG
ncbi:MAG: carbohydrate ABC transporter permease [Defluviitaleaceae bacterium]|nr:carbohydrate ABC transporter permease [Defluviitaleaceae bacterium]